jgi:hypothetical protein
MSRWRRKRWLGHSVGVATRRVGGRAFARPRGLKAKDLLRQGGNLPPGTINLFLEKRDLPGNVLQLLMCLLKLLSGITHL